MKGGDNDAAESWKGTKGTMDEIQKNSFPIECHWASLVTVFEELPLLIDVMVVSCS
jgi:hypothetical protein